MNTTQILTMIETSVRTNLVRLQAAKGADAGADCVAMLSGKGFFALDAKGAGYLAQTGIKPETLSGIFPADGSMNPKVQKRFIQLVNGLHAGAYKHIDATTARALIATRAAGGSLSRDALNNLITGRVKIEGICPNTKGVGIRALDRLVSRVGRGTVETQLSRSFGTNGFCTTLGMCTTTGRTNFDMRVIPDAVFAKRFFALVDGATEGQLTEMLGE